MSITTTIAPRYKWFNVFYCVLCLVFGVWGFYDYYVTIPAQREAYAVYQDAAEVSSTLQKAADTRALSRAEQQTYEKAEQTLTAFGGEVPSEPGKFNELIQFWGFFVTCGVLGFPYFLWVLIQASRRSYTLRDDGTLVTPDATWKKEEIADIDMSRWMAKSIAYPVHTDGHRVKLDDYKHKNMHLIIGSIAHEMYPEQWTEDARVNKDEPRNEPPEFDLQDSTTTEDEIAVEGDENPANPPQSY